MIGGYSDLSVILTLFVNYVLTPLAYPVHPEKKFHF